MKIYEYQLENEFIFWLQRVRHDCGFDKKLLIYPQFRICGKRPDIALFFTNQGVILDIIFIEIKIKKIADVLWQARQLRDYCNYQFALIPINDYAKARESIIDFNKLNVGLLIYDDTEFGISPKMMIKYMPDRVLLDKDNRLYYSKLISAKMGKYESNLMQYDKIAFKFNNYQIKKEETESYRDDCFLNQMIIKQ